MDKSQAHNSSFKFDILTTSLKLTGTKPQQQYAAVALYHIHSSDLCHQNAFEEWALCQSKANNRYNKAKKKHSFVDI
jgi:hypothetical protein